MSAGGYKRKDMEYHIYKSSQYVNNIISSDKIVCCISQTIQPMLVRVVGYGVDGSDFNSDVFNVALSYFLIHELQLIGWDAFEAKHGRTRWSLAADTLMQMYVNRFVDVVALSHLGFIPRLIDTELANLSKTKYASAFEAQSIYEDASK